MSVRRFLAVLLVAAILGTGMPNPPKSDANNLAVIIPVSIVAWFGLVILATYIIRNKNDSGFSQSSVSPFLANDRLALARRDESTVRVGRDCPGAADGSPPPLFCW